MTKKFIILFLFISHCSYAQWTQVEGPNEYGKATKLIATNNFLFASTECGTFTQKGLSSDWIKLAPFKFTFHAQINNKLYLSTYYDSFKMIDLSTPNLTVTESTVPYIHELAASPTCLYGGHSPKGFSYSCDGGQSWKIHNDSLPKDSMMTPIGQVFSCQVFSVSILDTLLFVATNKGIYRNTESLNNWTIVQNNLPIKKYDIIQNLNDTLFATSGKQLYMSSNRGLNWQNVLSATDSIICLEKNDQLLYFGTANNGIYKYNFITQTASPMNSNLTDLSIMDLAWFENTLICATKNQSIYKYLNGSWQKNMSRLYCNGTTRSIVTNQDKLIVNTTRGVYRFENSLQDWKNTSPTFTNGYISMLCTGDNALFASLKDSGDPNIYYSLTSGDTWKKLYTEPPYKGDDTYRISIDQNYLYAEEDNIIYKTNDFGNTWLHSNSKPDECENLPTPPNKTIWDCIKHYRISIIATSDGIYASDDNGKSWTDITENITDRYFRTLHVHSDTLFASTVNDGIWRKPFIEVKKQLPNASLGIYAYPNPAGYSIKIENLFNDSKYSIYDPAGKIVSSGRITLQIPSIDLNGIIPGIYFLAVYNGLTKSTQKIIVTK